MDDRSHTSTAGLVRKPKRQNSSLRSLMKQQSAELSIMMEIGKAITSSLHLEEVLQVIMGKVSALLAPTHWSLLLLDQETEELYFEIVVSPVAEQLKSVRLKLGEGIAGLVAASGEPMLVADARTHPRVAHRVDELVSFNTQSIICVPLMVKDQVFGVIEIINRLRDRAYTETDLAILSTIADFAAIAIDNARSYAKVNALVITDGLTGLFNARHFDTLLDFEVERCRRYRAPVSLVFFDLDHFKRVNDTHGHLVGSRILAEVGKLVRSHIRVVDIAARFGGDEYVILLPNTDKAGTLTVVGNLRNLLREHPFVSDDGEPIRVTASFGIAAMPEDALTKVDLLRLADMAMYQVKGSTRDGVHFADARKV